MAKNFQIGDPVVVFNANHGEIEFTGRFYCHIGDHRVAVILSSGLLYSVAHGLVEPAEEGNE